MVAYELFAWAAPIAGPGFADHTWVTGYDNRIISHPDIAAARSAGDDYWFCWGMYRLRGGTPALPDGYLCHRTANRRLARCLVLENEESRGSLPARGTIFRYGRDGVCHQLANQVLCAAGAPPLTAVGARGYSWSQYLYGTYGLQELPWSSQVQRCTGRPAPITRLGQEEVMSGDDAFEARATQLLGADEQALLGRLLELRARIHRNIARDLSIGPSDARYLNARNAAFKAEAARLLGEERFIRLFGFAPEEEMNLVDPEMLAQDEDPHSAVAKTYGPIGIRRLDERQTRELREEEDRSGLAEEY
jgi:hypothetical protein